MNCTHEQWPSVSWTHILDHPLGQPLLSSAIVEASCSFTCRSSSQASQRSSWREVGRVLWKTQSSKCWWRHRHYGSRIWSQNRHYRTIYEKWNKISLPALTTCSRDRPVLPSWSARCSWSAVWYRHGNRPKHLYEWYSWTHSRSFLSPQIVQTSVAD